MTGKRLCLATVVLLALATMLVPFAEARYYHPTLGRFINRDPNEYVDGLNLYNYTGNNPILLTDPMGGCRSSDRAQAPCKCFCVDSLKITQHEIEPKTRDPQGAVQAGPYQHVGAVFTVTLKGKWLAWENEFTPFGFEWWEWFTERPGKYSKDMATQKWHDIYERLPNDPVFDDVNWRKWTGRENIKDTYVAIDNPALTQGGIPGGGVYTQQAYFAIRASSSCPESMCPQRHDTAYAFQEYSVRQTMVEKNVFRPLQNMPIGEPTWKVGGPARVEK